MAASDMESWRYSDPARVLERQEEGPRKRSCAGCKEIRVKTDPFGGRRLTCRLGNIVGHRCNNYQERTSE